MKYKIITIIVTSLLILTSCANSDDNGGEKINTGSIITSETFKFKELTFDELEIQLQKDLDLIKVTEEKEFEEHMKEDTKLAKINEEENIKKLNKLIEEENRLAKIKEQKLIEELDKKYQEEQKILKLNQ